MDRAHIIMKLIVHQVLRESGHAWLCPLVRGRAGGGMPAGAAVGAAVRELSSLACRGEDQEGGTRFTG